MTQKLCYIKNNLDADILIMGSSRALHHYNDKILSDSIGVKCYNLGEDGNGIIKMYGYYKVLLKRYNPRLIVYDIEPCFDLFKYYDDNNNTRYINTLRLFCDDPEIKKIITTVSQDENYKLWSQLYRFNSRFPILIKDYFVCSDFQECGYQPTYGSLSKKQINNNDTHIISEVDSVKLCFLHRLIKETKENGTKLIFVLSPKLLNDDSKRDLSFLYRLCKDNDVPLIDWYSEKQFISDSTLFKDRNHLNNSGATLFSEMLSRQLKDIITDNIIE